MSAGMEPAGSSVTVMDASRRPTLREEHADLSKKKDMGEVEVTEEDTEVRNNWRWEMRCE